MKATGQNYTKMNLTLCISEFTGKVQKKKKERVCRLHSKITQTDGLTFQINLEYIPAIPKCDS